MSFIGFLAIAMWGTLALLGHLTKGLPPFQLLFLCFLISASLLFVKRLLLKQRLFAKPTLDAKGWLIGVMGLFGFHFCYFMALKYASALNVSLIAYLWPMLLALLLANKKERAKALLGSVVGFIGVTLLLIRDQYIELNANELIGYGYALTCAVIWALYSFFTSKMSSQVDDIGWLSLFVAALAFVAHLLLESTVWQFEATSLIAILLLGIGPVGGAFYLWDIGMKRGDAKLLASLSYSSPLISAVLLTTFGLSPWSITIFVALAFIVIGGVIATRKSACVSD